MDEREAQFINSIDCCFPYADTERALRLIDEAITISPNAVFCILYELAIPGHGDEVTPAQRHQYVSYLKSKFSHPLVPLVISVVEGLIDGQETSVADAIANMRVIADFPGEYGALSIFSMACDDIHDEAGAVYDEIRRSWEQMPPQ